MHRRTIVLLIVGVAVSLFCVDASAESTKRKQSSQNKTPKYLKIPYANPPGDPSLPNVLLIGDSISIGYTIPVRKQLQGKANVYRPAINCRYSSYGVKHVKSWLGKRKWDVIHFNWGIWDTHYMRDGRLVRGHNENKYPLEEMKLRCPKEEYVENLKKILPVLEATGAKLIWASSTPVRSRRKEHLKDIAQYNRAAAQLMKKRGIAINDLRRFVLPHLDKWQTKDLCHYNELGCQKLGEEVAQHIEKTLKQKTPVGQAVLGGQ